MIDEYTREALAIDVAGSIRSARVIEVLARLVSVHGAPRSLDRDNGPEFVSQRDPALARPTQGSNCALSDPGKPWQNGTDESFNGKLPRRVPEHGVVSQPRTRPSPSSRPGDGTTTRSGRTRAWTT